MENSKRFSSIISATEIQAEPLLEQCHSIFSDANAMGFAALNLNTLSQEISVSGDDLIKYFLKDTEHEHLRSFSSAKRQVEWLGGRIAAKRGARNLFDKTEHGWHDLEITTDTHGRPQLNSSFAPHHGLDISISHSGSLAASFCCKGGTCGLDIQKITPTVERISEKFATNEEIAILHGNKQLKKMDMSTILTLLWSAKEAFRKAVPRKPLLGFLDVHLSKIRGYDQDFTGYFSCDRKGAPPQLTACLSLHNEYACAMTVVPSSQ